MKSRQILILTAVILLGLPSVVLANVGTPLMWAHALSLLVGNLCLGILEGALLSWVYKIRAGRAVGLMIMANYFSAWLGRTSLARANAEDFGNDVGAALAVLGPIPAV